MDPKILNMFAIESSAEFIMEVTEKTKADVKVKASFSLDSFRGKKTKTNK